MNALTAVAATVYAIGLWMFAPESVWRREVEQAKANQQRRLNPTPEPIPQPQPEPIQEPIQTPKPQQEPEPVAVPTTEPTPEPITETEELLPDTESDTESDTATDTTPESTTEPQQPDYTQWTINQLREEAKSRKLQWRPLINGKRTPLKKPQLIELLTA